MALAMEASSATNVIGCNWGFLEVNFVKLPDLTPESQRPLAHHCLLQGAVSACAMVLTLVMAAPNAFADVVPGLYGTPSLIDMPTGETLDDGTISVGVARSSENLRFSSSFQVVPSINIAFRYSGIGDLGGYVDSSGFATWDRSLDITARLWPEGAWIPAVSGGVRDIMGTGILASEYIVATKSLTPDVSVTAGLGWGRLATGNQIGATGSRPSGGGGGLGGSVRLQSLFRGDVGVFGGLRWQTPVDGLSLAIEYSSDDYSAEAPFGVSGVKSPWSVGLNWKPRSDLNIGLAALNGRGLAFNLTAIIDPQGPDVVPKREWVPKAGQSVIAGTMAGAGVVPLAYEQSEGDCELAVSAAGVRSASVAVERTGRAMKADGCSHATIHLVHEGMSLSETHLDLPGKQPKVVSVGMAEAQAVAGDLHQPSFAWEVSPLVRFSIFDPDHPLYHDLSVAVRGSYHFSPGLSLSGQMSRTVVGDFDKMTRGPKGSLPRVRTETYRYAQKDGPRLDYLTFDMFHQHSDRVFSRVSLGYLETQYAGVSAEIYARLLNWPVAVGAELNYLGARDFDQGFGLRTLEGLSKINGHASVYWGTGFHDLEVQLDAGRYLAGDLGATLSITRDFSNGWEVGAFATVTSASASQFGEGSFDKGIFIRIPVAVFSKRETGLSAKNRISSLTGDGGQRVAIRNRLHEIVSRGAPLHRLTKCGQTASCFSF